MWNDEIKNNNIQILTKKHNNKPKNNMNLLGLTRQTYKSGYEIGITWKKIMKNLEI